MLLAQLIPDERTLDLAKVGRKIAAKSATQAMVTISSVTVNAFADLLLGFITITEGKGREAMVRRQGRSRAGGTSMGMDFDQLPHGLIDSERRSLLVSPVCSIRARTNEPQRRDGRRGKPALVPSSSVAES